MKKVQFLSLTIALGALITISSCLRKSYDNPPDLSGYDPQLPVNMTIANLKTKFTGTDAKRIDSNWTIVGIVNADDRSGNFYKQINIEDSTGGITILVDNYNLYTKYPIGRKVYINLKGLYYGYYGKFPQLGGAVDDAGSLAGIPATSVDSFIVRANFPNPVPVTHFANLAALSNGLNTNMIGRLVEIDSVEVADADMYKTYAQPSTISSGTSINIEDCYGSKKIVMRSSAYANFQAINLPQGKGKIVALYTNYNTTPQLVIRDTTDLQFYGTRCSGSTPPASNIVSVDSIRKLYAGADVALGSYKMKGVIISSTADKNSGVGNIVVQDGGKGITVYYGSTSPTADLGDSVLIDVSGLTLTSYQGALEIKTASNAKTTIVASGKSVTPVQLTIAQLVANFSNYESTLVQIANATATPAGTFSGSKTLSDGSGSTITLYTASTALFAGTTMPTTPKTFVGIATPFNTTKELKLRRAADVF